MKSRKPDSPFNPKGLAPPPAWQVAKAPVRARAWDLPTERRGYDPRQVCAYFDMVLDQIETMERRVSGLPPGSNVVTADQVRRRQFATVRRGFDQDVVRAQLEAFAARLEPLEAPR